MLKVLMVLAALFAGQNDEYVKADERRVEKFKKILEKNSDDQEAALQLGRHLCFVKGDWEAGLPLLAKGKDKALADLAQFELAIGDPKNEAHLTGATLDFGEQAGPD